MARGLPQSERLPPGWPNPKVVATRDCESPILPVLKDCLKDRPLKDQRRRRAPCMHKEVHRHKRRRRVRASRRRSMGIKLRFRHMLKDRPGRAQRLRLASRRPFGKREATRRRRSRLRLRRPPCKKQFSGVAH